MRNLKKTLVFVTVLAMLLSVVAPVFAAAPADVAGTSYEDAVNKLVALGVVAGDADTGNYRPNDQIKRSEFAKVACEILGLGTAADLAKGTTKFSDVKADHWASGYVNVATEKGLIKGYPDKTFKPDAEVTYAEAVTILVRALGMGPVVEGKGTWPANYLARASSAGITDDVTGLVGSAKAIRGAIAQMAWNTLDAEKWGEKEYTTDGIVYGPLGKSLLEDQYKNYVYKDANGKYVTKNFEDVRVVGTQLAGGVDNDEIILENDDTLNDLVAANYDSADAGTDPDLIKLTVKATGYDLNSFFGKKVNLLLGKDNEVYAISVASSTSDVVEGYVTDLNTDDDKIEINDKEYSMATGAVAYVNTKSVSAAVDDLNTLLGDRKVKITAVLDSGKVKYANMFSADVLTGLGGGVTMYQFVVKEVKSNGEVTNIKGEAKQFDIDDATDDMDKLVVVRDGKAAKIEDVKVGDAVTYVKNGDLYYIVASSKQVTGKITRVASDDDSLSITTALGLDPAAAHTRREMTIDGKAYTMTLDGSTLVTKNGEVDDEDLKNVDGNIGDFYNKDATLTLNAVDEIVLVNGKVTASASMQVGIVTTTLKEGTNAGETVYYLQLLTPAGEKKTFEVTGDEFNANAIADGTTSNKTVLGDYKDDAKIELGLEGEDFEIAKGSIVVYSVSANGKIDAANLYDTREVAVNDTEEKVFIKPVVQNDYIALKDSTTKLYVGAAADSLVTYFANESTVYMVNNTAVREKLDGWDAVVSDDDWASTSAAKQVGAAASHLDSHHTILDEPFVMVYDEEKNIKEIITSVNTDDEDYTLTNDAEYAIFKSLENRDNDSIVTLYVNGADKEYTVSGSVYDDFTLAKGDFLSFKLNSDGKYKGGDDVGLADRSKIVDNNEDYDTLLVDKWYKAERRIDFEDAGTDSAFLASDVKIYDVRDTSNIKMGTLDDLANGQYVVVADLDTDDDVYQVVVIVD